LGNKSNREKFVKLYSSGKIMYKAKSETIKEKTEFHFLDNNISCSLEDTPDKMGYIINLEGVFRHGGMSKLEIKNILKETLRKIDFE